MNETSDAREPAGPDDQAGADGTDAADAAVRRAAQEPLPFDDEADRPIPFALTARARREVAPEQLPPLQVVPDPAAPEDLDAAGDTRPARARALCRSGLAVATIAHRLAVDELVVRAWVDDVATTAARCGPTAPRGVPPTGPTAVPASERDDRHAAFERAREAARDAVRPRLAGDAAFVAGLGLAAGLVEVDPHAVTAAVRSAPVAARLLAWLGDHAGVDRRQVRVVLRLGAGLAGDLERHRWADALGLAVDRVAYTRWRVAPAPHAAEALLRVADGELAARLAGWCDALLETGAAVQPVDAAF